jgi:hypothetical protein
MQEHAVILNTDWAAYHLFVSREESCDAILSSVLLAYMDVFRIVIIIILIIIIVIVIISSSLLYV